LTVEKGGLKEGAAKKSLWSSKKIRAWCEREKGEEGEGKKFLGEDWQGMTRKGGMEEFGMMVIQEEKRREVFGG